MMWQHFASSVSGEKKMDMRKKKKKARKKAKEAELANKLKSGDKANRLTYLQDLPC